MMSNFLPKGWVHTKLLNVCEDVQNVKPSDTQTGSFLYLDIGGIDNSANKIISYKTYQWQDAPSRAKQIVKSGDILFSTVRTYLKNIALVESKLDGQIASTGFCIVRPNRNAIISKFCFYLCLSSDFLQKLNKLQTGSSYPAVRDKDVFNQTISLPPLAEQHRIVAKIEELFSELDNGVAQLRRVQAQLKSYRQSVLKHAFEGKLTEAWRQQHDGLPNAQELLITIQQERYTRHQQALKDWQQSVIQWTEAGKPGGTPLGKKPIKPKAPKELPPLTEEEIAKLPALPEGWGWTEMKAIVLEACLGKMLDKKKNKGELMPYLRNINVRWFSFETDDLLEMRFEQSEHDRYSVEKGDLVICEGGEPGRAAIWDGRIANMKIQKALHRVRFFNHLIHNKFILYYLSYSASTGHLAKFFTGTTIKHLTGKGLSDLTIPLCSTEEQHQIVQEIESRLSVAEHLEKTIKESLHQAEVLRQSILQRAFTGQLVPQDPDDEPANELLKRIQEKKSGSKTQSKKAKAASTDEQLSITF